MSIFRIVKRTNHLISGGRIIRKKSKNPSLLVTFNGFFRFFWNSFLNKAFFNQKQPFYADFAV